MLGAVAFLFSIIFYPVIANSATTVSSVVPAGVQRGQEVTVQMFGAELTDPQDVDFYHEGIELIELEAVTPKRIKARLRIAKDCPLGQMPFRLATGRGISNLKLIGVTALPCVIEVEPGTDADASVGMDVPREATVLGTLEAEDDDVFGIELKAGEPFSFEVEGLRHGRVEMDPEIEISDPSGRIVHRSDDTTLTRRDPAGTYHVEADGKHTIRIRDARRIGNGAFQYLLHLGKFPRPMMGFPGGGRPGEEVTVKWQQPGCEPWEQKVRLSKEGTQTEFVYASNKNGIAPTANEFRIVDLPTIKEVEPNNTYSAPQKITVPTAVVGVLGEHGDEDIFQFAAKKDQRVDIRVFARRFLRSPVDAMLRVRKVGGNQVAFSDDINGEPDGMIEFTVPEDGEYGVYVGDHIGRGGPEYAYRLELAPIQSGLTLRSPERVFRTDPSVNLARGNRMAVLINVERQHFEEEVELDWGQLPKGMKVEAPTIPKDQDRVPVVFEIAADAKRGGYLLGLAGRAKVGEELIEGQYHQRTPLVRGQNNRDVWGYDTDKLAVAVTDESVFTIEAHVPTVPLVRNGSLPLIVSVDRHGDFKGELKLNLLHTPPGVAAQRDVMLPADKDSVAIHLTANKAAQLATTPIVVTAEAKHDSVAYITSSRLTKLRVEDSIFSVAFEKASVEQGKQTEMVVKVTNNREYDGSVVAELVGLPSGATSKSQDVPVGTERLTFPIRVTKTARPGRFNTVICQLKVMPKPDATAADSIMHVLGTGQLRIDKPLDPPTSKPNPNPKPNPKTDDQAKTK